MTAPPCSRVLLVGFMGAGKSTVGRRVAARLGWRFVDMDAEVERRQGRSIPEIFRERGEAAFREMEAAAAADLLTGERTVLAAGGGWAATPGRLDSLPHGTVSVWLDVTAEEALGRVRAEAGARPLLAVKRPLDVARALLDARRSAYAAADYRVDTNGLSVDDVTARILEILVELEIESSTE